MKKSINYIIILCSIGIVIACTKDFISKDIKNSTVNVIAPANNLSTPNNAITFWWDELEGAEKYNLQIVKPRFDSILQLIVDTTITGNKFNHTFTPGKYQWRIKGINGGGSTVYTTRTLVIDTTSNLLLVKVNPNLPVDNFKTSNKTITFSWNTLYAASSYNLVISDASGQIASFNTANTSYQYTFASAGIYSWKVQAQNSFSFSLFNTPRYLKIDLTAPSAPAITSPTNNASATDTVHLTWVRSSSDVWYDSLFISTDSFASQIRYMSVYDKKLQINLINPSLSTGNYYFWRLKSIDSAGNISPYSSPKKFKLIP